MNLWTSLEKAAILTDDILAAANRDDWITAAQIEGLRNALIKALGGFLPHDADEANKALQVLKRIEATNTQIDELSKRRHEEIGALLSTLEKSRKSTEK